MYTGCSSDVTIKNKSSMGLRLNNTITMLGKKTDDVRINAPDYDYEKDMSYTDWGEKYEGYVRSYTWPTVKEDGVIYTVVTKKDSEVIIGAWLIVGNPGNSMEYINDCELLLTSEKWKPMASYSEGIRSFKKNSICLNIQNVNMSNYTEILFAKEKDFIELMKREISGNPDKSSISDEMQLSSYSILSETDIETEQNQESANNNEIQKKVDRQFTKIDKSRYTLVNPEESIIMAMFGIGNSYEVGKRYKTIAITAVNTQYGATFTNSIQSFVDSDKKVIPELTGYASQFYIYFKVNRISGNDHFITLEYIDLSE
jgi:hypothetical protein